MVNIIYLMVTKKKTITKSQKMILIGLMAVAKSHAKQFTDAERMMNEVVGEDETFGHMSDQIFENDDAIESVRIALKKIGITVK